MTPLARIVAFSAAVVLAAGIGAGIGSAVGPIDVGGGHGPIPSTEPAGPATSPDGSAPAPPTSADHDGHGG